MKVLISDDNSNMRALVKRLCGDFADEFIECSDGSEAVEAYARHRPDMVLMDVRLPGLDGYSATARIRSRFPEARIVIVTQFSGEHFVRAAREAGAIGFVPKDELERLREVLDALTSLGS